ncbi:MAG TPA: hypothetical protein VNJ08_02250 [Bacteriovoracaceae bacterium]|nr:hypothetical protein [Bacteriovoracaceae bacterium]
MKMMPLVLALCFLNGCSTTAHRSQSTGSLDASVKSNLHAEIDVDMTKQVKGTAHHQKVLWFIPVKDTNRYAEGVTYNGGGSGWNPFAGGIVDETKAAAAYNAVVPNKIDVLVAPQYLVQVKSYVFGIWKDVTVSVTGYAGKIRDIKSQPKK